MSRNSERGPGYDYLFKVVLVGDSETGKTNILSRFTRDQFTPEVRCTIGVEFGLKVVSVAGKSVKVQAWDTAGQEKYMAITRSYYRGAIGALIIYDVTNRTSFDNVEKWLTNLKEYNEGVYNAATTPIVVVGNKCDLETSRVVSTKEGSEYAKENGLLFMETSAKDNIDVDKVFDILCRAILENAGQVGNSAPKQELAVGYNAVPLDQDNETEGNIATISTEDTDNIPAWGQVLMQEVEALALKMDMFDKLESKVDALSNKVDALDAKVNQMQQMSKPDPSRPKKVDFKTAQSRSVKR